MKNYQIVKGAGSLSPLEKDGPWRFYSVGAIMQLTETEAKALCADGRAIPMDEDADPVLDAEHLLGVPGDEDRLATLTGESNALPSGVAVLEPQEAPRPFAPIAPVVPTDGEKLTPKQALVKEAEELGLDTDGRAAELQERIDAKRAEDENQGN